jgi:hypothetical protein
MGGVSAAVYVVMNYLSQGLVIADAVTAIGVWIAFYYGLTGFTCAWYYRRTLMSSARNFLMRGLMPVLGGLMLYFALVWSIGSDFNFASGVSYTSWTLPFGPRWVIGGVFLIALVSALVGLVIMVAWWLARPPFFQGKVLSRSTSTLVLDEPVIPGVIPPSAAV